MATLLRIGEVTLSAAPSVAVTIVTYNSVRYIAQCLENVLAQRYSPLSVVVVDNASSDGTQAILARFESAARILYNNENRGFAGGQNQAIAAAGEAAWVLTLNADVRLSPGFMEALVGTGEKHQEAGSVCPKLLSAAPDFSVPAQPLLDSAGIYFTPSQRHFDRGSRVPDHGQYNTGEYVFGGTGAACLYRREMIADISVWGQFFDEDFFIYREDADVAWRAQLLGWKSVYQPEALGYHVRTVVPENRRSLSAAVNMHSVKNRWLMRIKNMTGDLYRRHWLRITARDAIVAGACVTREQSSLRAFAIVAKLWKQTWAKRRVIQSRRRVTNQYMAEWFSDRPVSFPLKTS